MKIKRFEEVIAWQKAIDLGVVIYQQFGPTQHTEFASALCSVAISISTSIAEGFNKRSKKAYRFNLSQALSACDQVKSMIYLAEKLDLIDDKQAKEVLAQCEECAKVIYGLYRALQPQATKQVAEAA